MLTWEMICLPLWQFVALMEVRGQDTPRMVMGLVVLWRVRHWRGIRLAGSQTLPNTLGAMCFMPASRRGWISLLPSFLREMGDRKVCIAEMREQKGNWFCVHLTKRRGKSGCRIFGLSKTLLSLFQCVSKKTCPPPGKQTLSLLQG